jgi:hypothetical protein
MRIHDAVLPDYVTLAEIYAALPLAKAEPADPIALGQKLHARAGNILGGCEKLFNAGCAGRTNDFRYYRVPGAEVPEGRVAAWLIGGGTAKTSDTIGNFGMEGGAANAHRSEPPLRLYGEDKNRPRVPLEAVRKRDAAIESLAKSYVAADIARSNEPGVLSAAADAHESASEMLRVRVKRLQSTPTTVAAE